MTYTYQLTGMTCSSCEAKVTYLLESLPAINSVVASKDTNSAVIDTSTAVSIETLQMKLGGITSKYQLAEGIVSSVVTKTWLETYKPLLLIFGYITLVVTLAVWQQQSFEWMVWMRYFMAGFFLIFSFFKLLNLKGFAESYAMYDVLAKKIPAWGYLYAFLELLLGIAYLIDFQPIITNSIAFLLMSLSIIGVLQSVLNKQKIQCACLGSVFELPMSTVTIIEDALMVAMSGSMLLAMA